ncbi:MAG TPA: hypothetical protein PLC82_11760, partial [Smithellaceae bacterium]|nr:hypothetical protein [Smithellaceae bacterium]
QVPDFPANGLFSKIYLGNICCAYVWRIHHGPNGRMDEVSSIYAIPVDDHGKDIRFRADPSFHFHRGFFIEQNKIKNILILMKMIH